MNAPVNPQVAVLGTGAYLPERRVTNDVLRDLCSNYDEEQSGDFSTWVDRVTHIHERRFIAEGETAGMMAAEASKRALDMAGVKAGELDLIIHASFTPSVCVPGDHVVVAERIGAHRTPSFTLTAACAGSIQAMGIAYGLLTSGLMRRILVTGAETISPTLDFRDPLTAILFGDGAGAAVLGRVDRSEGGMFAPSLGFEFNWENISMDNANMPFGARVAAPSRNGSPPTVEKTYIRMSGGQSVLRNAVNNMVGSVRAVLGMGEDSRKGEMDEYADRLRIVPHQANGRIVDGITRKLGLDPLRVLKTVYLAGNISAASNLIALDFGLRRGNLTADRDPETERILAVHEVPEKIRPGDIVVMPSIGAGYLYGAVGFVNAIG